jgi:predicted DNA-binding protein with PD1-like motif
MEIVTLRLKPNQDLKEELNKFAKDNKIKAGVILTCVGSLKNAKIRFANERVVKAFNEKFEIVSLVGTLSENGNHIHISISNAVGETIGGHLKEGCIIYTTAEIVIGKIKNISFTRELDDETKFRELKIIEI